VREKWIPILTFAALLALQGCAGVSLTHGNRSPIPLDKANLATVFAENEGLEVTREDAKDVRDLYRAGVQQKAKAEKLFEEKAYQEAMKFYEVSNDFFSKLFQFVRGDSAEYALYEKTHILFFPDLLVADNYFKMGMIDRTLGREEQAQAYWKYALSFVQKSLQSERTEWGLSLERKVSSLLATKKN
jgi:tetratricopeptide (TPR) repeat protein